MNVEDALQMCGAASVDFTGGEWCYAAKARALLASSPAKEPGE